MDISANQARLSALTAQKNQLQNEISKVKEEQALFSQQNDAAENSQGGILSLQSSSESFSSLETKLKTLEAKLAQIEEMLGALENSEDNDNKEDMTLEQKIDSANNRIEELISQLESGEITKDNAMQILGRLYELQTDINLLMAEFKVVNDYKQDVADIGSSAIQEQDKKFEMQLENLETQREALAKEIESVEKIIDSDVASSSLKFNG